MKTQTQIQIEDITINAPASAITVDGRRVSDMEVYDRPSPIGRPFIAKFNGVCAYSGIKTWRGSSQLRPIAEGYDPVSGVYLNKRYVLEVFTAAACLPARWQQLQIGNVDAAAVLESLCVEGRKISILDKHGKTRPPMEFTGGRWKIGHVNCSFGLKVDDRRSKSTAQIRRSFCAAVAYEVIK